MTGSLDTSDHTPDAAELSRAIAALETVRTDFATEHVETHLGDDLVTVLLHYALTPGEEELIRQGSEFAVLELRYELQMIMKPELVAIVEAACGRAVNVFTSANHVAPNVGVEVFLLGERIDAGATATA